MKPHHHFLSMAMAQSQSDIIEHQQNSTLFNVQLSCFFKSEITESLAKSSPFAVTRVTSPHTPFIENNNTPCTINLRYPTIYSVKSQTARRKAQIRRGQ